MDLMKNHRPPRQIDYFSVDPTYLYSLPLVFLAIFLGLKISRKIPAEKFNKYVYVMLLGLGIILLIKVIVA